MEGARPGVQVSRKQSKVLLAVRSFSRFTQFSFFLIRLRKIFIRAIFTLAPATSNTSGAERRKTEEKRRGAYALERKRENLQA